MKSACLSSRPDRETCRPGLLHSLFRAEIAALCAECGHPAYRAAQLWQWLYAQGVRDWAGFGNLPRSLIADLSRRFSLHPAVLAETRGAPGAFRKLLVELPDGERIEEVLIPAPGRRTVCVSSQAGCRFRCAFCASGQAGFRRNLAAGEMVGQVLVAGEVFGERPTHVVFMGIGEPLDNYDNVLRAVRIINDGEGLAIGARRITLSTCGLVPGIQQLAREGLQIELSVSLHAASDELRSRLMPINRRYPLARLLATCRDYSAKTGRIITFEYALIGGVNDAPGQARDLARLLAGRSGRVNLIPLSAVEEFPARPSPAGTADMFVRTLTRAGINATIRASRGGSLKAACGQLRFGRRDAAGGQPAAGDDGSAV